MSTTSLEAAAESIPFNDWRPDHSGLRVNNRDDAIAWYTGTLGLKVVETIEIGGDISYVYLATPACDAFRIELVAGPGAANRPAPDVLADSLGLSGWHHFCFRVDDVDASIEELRRRKVTILGQPFDVAPIRSRIAFFTDPWGNVFELMQVQAA